MPRRKTKVTKRKNIVQVQATMEQKVYASCDTATSSKITTTKTTYSINGVVKSTKTGVQVLSAKATSVTTAPLDRSTSKPSGILLSNENLSLKLSQPLRNRNSADSSGIGSVLNSPLASPPLSISSDGVTGANHKMSCACSHCGEMWSTSDEITSDEESESEMDEDEIRANNRMNMLMIQNAKAKRLLQTNKYYNKILTTQKIIREQQLMVLQRANKINSMFVKAMDIVIRLGFCPLMLQSRTDCISHGLLDTHKLIQDWDCRLEHLIPDQKAVLPSLLHVFKERYGTNIEAMSDAQFEEALRKSMDQIPGLVPDEESVKAALDEMNLKQVEHEWELFEQKVESRLLCLEIELIDLCVQFGVRTGIPRVTGYEWAVAVGPRKKKSNAS